MDIILTMAGVTLGGRFPVFLAGFMTTPTLYLFARVPTQEKEVRLGMIECFRIEGSNVCLPALVFSVADMTCLFPLAFSVKPFFLRHIACNVFVTALAKAILSGFVESLMTGVTFLLPFCMAFHHLSRH